MKWLADIWSLLLSVALAMAGCTFTGVERTDRISDKDAAHAINRIERGHVADSLLPRFVPAEKGFAVGQQFYVTDNQLGLLLSDVDGNDADSIALAGRLLTVAQIDTSTDIGGRNTVALTFTDGKHRLRYDTGRTTDQIASGAYSIPLLIDMRLVHYADSLLRHRVVYALTSLWHDPTTGNRLVGRRYVPVRVDSVIAGNKVFPLQVVFTEVASGCSAAVWAAPAGSAMTSRDVNVLFSTANPRLRYPAIDDATWAHITNGTVMPGMTKEQCRLAKGNPERIIRRPEQGAVHEYWDYDGGTLLHFEDGLLVEDADK